MELKFAYLLSQLAVLIGSNRTFMELKYGKAHIEGIDD